MSDDANVYMPAAEPSAPHSALAALAPGEHVLAAGFRVVRGYAPLREPLVLDKDVAVELRDGTTIYTDIFRPVGDGAFPVIVSWSPYGKSGGTDRLPHTLRMLVGVDQHELSGLMKWEGVDPARWCANGFAVCHPDARGVGDGEGDIQVFGVQEGRDICDLVEWLADQPWCTGKVGMAGNSWLAVCQWFAAAQQPAHLAAIAPWEGFCDVYRDVVAPGGIPDLGFIERIASKLPGRQRVESPTRAFGEHPLFDAYWANKEADVGAIAVPVYAVASYSSTVHCPGTFRAWRGLGSEHTWLRIHDRQEWPDFYDDANQEDLLRFMGHFLKGEDNGWERTARVRYSLLDLEGGDRTHLPADRFPPAGVTPVRFYLDGADPDLVTAAPAGERTAAYRALAHWGGLEYTVAFERETHVVGYPRLRLWVECEGHDDMDLFVFLQKLDVHGRHLEVQTSGEHNPLVGVLTHVTASVLKYHAALGRMRVSLRHLDTDRSTDAVPVQSFDRVEKLLLGQVVPVDIAIYPVGFLLYPGESLRLIVTGHNLVGAPMPGARGPKGDNHGRHIVHTGGRHDSHLVLPIRQVTAEPVGAPRATPA